MHQTVVHLLECLGNEKTLYFSSFYCSNIYRHISQTCHLMSHDLWMYLCNSHPSGNWTNLIAYVPTSPFFKVLLATSEQPQILHFVCPSHCPDPPVVNILVALLHCTDAHTTGFVSIQEFHKQMHRENGARWASLTSLLLEAARKWRKSHCDSRIISEHCYPSDECLTYIIFMLFSVSICTCIINYS